MKRKRTPSRSAFTLAEVMVAAVVVSLGLIGMIQALVAGSEMLDLAKKQTLATQIIHGQMEDLRLRTWAQVDTFNASSIVKVDAADHGGDQSANVNAGFVFGPNLPSLSKTFLCERTITSVRDGLKQVTYTVTWTAGTGRVFTRTSSTYFGRNGLYVTYQRS